MAAGNAVSDPMVPFTVVPVQLVYSVGHAQGLTDHHSWLVLDLESSHDVPRCLCLITVGETRNRDAPT